MTPVKEVAISEFKAKCTALVDRVAKTKQPIRITRHGKPVADVVPATPTVDPKALMGSMRNSITILGDIIAPVIDLDEIEALRD
jgi:prevent-host-death family protein